MEQTEYPGEAEEVGDTIERVPHSGHDIPLSVLIVGTETAVFDPKSPVRRRIFSSFAAFREVQVLVLCGRGYTPAQEGRFRLYPTNAPISFLRPLGAALYAWKIRRPDVVSAQDPFETGLAALLIARARRVPLHVQVHTDLFAPEYRRHSFLNRIRAAIARFVLRRAARVRVVSGRIKRDLESLLRLRVPITVLPIFADAERFRYALPDPDLQERFAGYAHRLLVVSRLEPEKAVERAIRAFSEEAPENSCLVIVGEGRLRRELQEYAASVRRGRHIFFEGARDPAPYYKMADVVLVTSEYEGYGLVIAEALAAGTPVIAGDVGAARELGAIVAPPERYGEALAEWFQRGPREGRLLGYPYRDFQAYVRAYCDDIAACVQTQK